MLELDFMQRALIAGLLVAFTCPIIGTFLVVKRQSLIGDGLGHIAFAGVSAGWIFRFDPLLSAAFFTVLGAVAIEKLRSIRSDFSDLILAIFFYFSMATAIILSGLKGAGGVSLTSILFGSIVTVSIEDLYTIGFIGFLTVFIIFFIYKKLLYIAFDEENAKITGQKVDTLNMIFCILTALTIVVSMRIVGILLVSAMMVIPVACALPWRKSFFKTMLIALFSAIASVLIGLTVSFYLDIAPGGAIVITSVILFFVSEIMMYFQKK